MKRMLGVVLASVLVLAVCGQARAAGPEAAPKPSPSLDQVAAQVKALLSKEKVQTRFDLLRQLQAQGLTWQPSLAAPNDLVGKLGEEQLRLYAGIKLFDAVYAATFNQRQAVADSVKTLEAIQDKLAIRSYADVSGAMLATLKKAAAAPESANVPALIDQVAADFTRDVPALMKSPKSAAYLVDVLYGFTIETGYVLGYFHRADAKGQGKVMKAVPQQKGGISDWLDVLLQVHEAVGRGNETITVKGKAVPRMDLIKELIRVRKDPDQSAEKVAANRASAYGQAEAIRGAILSPPAK